MPTAHLMHMTKWLMVGLVLILILTKLLMTSTSSWLCEPQFMHRDSSNSWLGLVNCKQSSCEESHTGLHKNNLIPMQLIQMNLERAFLHWPAKIMFLSSNKCRYERLSTCMGHRLGFHPAVRHRVCNISISWLIVDGNRNSNSYTVTIMSFTTRNVRLANRVSWCVSII